MKNQFSSAVLQLKREMEYRNYSETSVKSYCESMATFERFNQKSLQDLTPDDLKNYLHYLITEKKCSTSYVNQHISAFKIFQTDILKKKWAGVEVKRPRLEKKIPEILSLAEIHLVLNLVQNLKHRVMLQTMYTAGLRRSELLNLKPKDIDSANGCIMVRQGKGKKDRQTLLSTKVLEELRLYYKIFRPSVYLFEPSGKKGIKMSPRTLEHIVKNVVAKAGIKKEVSCHTFRHSFATHLLDQGTSLKVIQELLGHTSIRTTSIYLHLSSGSIARVASPFDSL